MTHILRTLTLGLAVLLTLSTSVVSAADTDGVSESDLLVRLETSAGDITVKLFPDKAPITVANFLGYVESGHYNNTLFHRVINNFMIQGGGFDRQRKEKPTNAAIINESMNKLHNTRGTLAMARTNDPNSATAQFFINQRSNLRLDWSPGRPGYTVFGEVVDGMSVVDFIATAETGFKQFTTSMGVTGFRDVPLQDVVLERAVRVEQP